LPNSYLNRKYKRSSRLWRLLKHLRPKGMPLTYRRNSVELLPEGRLFFQALFSAIRSAEHSILLEYYIIRADSTGSLVADELSKAVARGVRVMLIYDYIGCLETPTAYFDALAMNGIELTPFNAPSFKKGLRWFDRRDHRKIAIIDGHTAFLGGFNISDKYSGVLEKSLGFRDMGFRINGTSVRELIHTFFETWQLENGTIPQLGDSFADTAHRHRHGKANVVIVSGSPHQRTSYIRNAFLFSIASATEEIIIANPYFVPGPRIIRALLRAARRGVRVRLLLPARSDVKVVLLVGRSSYSALLHGGVEIYEMDHEILHAKVMLIDGERTVIGSANLDQRSFHRNFEVNAMIDSSSFGNEIGAVLNHDIKLAARVLLEHHERRGVLTKLLEKLINLFGWFL